MKTIDGPAAPLPFFNVKDFGALGDDSTNDTDAFQDAIDAAGAVVGTTWSVSTLAVVFVPPGDYILDQIKMREGVYIVGGSPYATRLRFTFLIHNDCVICYDDGTTQIKNFGLSCLALMIDYSATGPGDARYIALRNCVEPKLSNLRIIQHKGAVGGGQMNVTGILLERVINADVKDVVIDGGLRGIVGAGTGWGSKNGRFVDVHCYNQKDIGIGFYDTSTNNTVNGVLVEFIADRAGTGYGLVLGPGCDFNEVAAFKATGVGVKEGAYVNGSVNHISGQIESATTCGIRLLGDRNNFTGTIGATTTVIDTGKVNTYTLPRHNKGAGVQRFEPNSATLATVSTWYSVAHAILPGNSAVLITVTLLQQLEGVGRVGLRKRFFVQRATGAVVISEDTAEGFASGTGMEVQIIAGSNIAAAVIQVRRTSGSSTVAAPVIELTEPSALVTSATLKNGGA